MPKDKSSRRALLYQWIKEDACFTTDGCVVFCQPCGKHVHCSKRFQLQQHLKTSSHVAANHKTKGKWQSFLTQSNEDSAASTFSRDLCQALVGSNIPWNKVNCASFRNFLEKYCSNQTIPDESTLRKNYLDILYNAAIEDIRSDIGDECIWVAADETTDSCGRYVANIMVGKLSSMAVGKAHLLACKVLEKTNHATIARFFNDSLRLLWPETGNEQKVLLFLTDAAAYMLKAATTLKVFYPNLIHCTCLAHALNRVAEKVRELFPSVNNLIANTKKVFIKAPLRVQYYKEKLPETPLPPAPVVTRWGTWLEAAMFYAKNFEDVKKVVDTFSSDDAVCVASAKSAFMEPTIRQDLAVIQSYFSCLAPNIKALEAAGWTLHESLKIIDDTTEQLKKIPGRKGLQVVEKLEYVLNRNPGYEILSSIAAYLDGSSTTLPAKITPDQVHYFKFCPTTTVDVERSFSSYKLILTDRRKHLTEENIEKLLVCYCNGRGN